VLFGAAVAQLHTAKRHPIDPIDQLAQVVLIRVEPKVVLRFGFIAQSRDQYARIIWNPHAVSGQKPQTRMVRKLDLEKSK
jgi:hypothetical protein